MLLKYYITIDQPPHLCVLENKFLSVYSNNMYYLKYLHDVRNDENSTTP
jgi:hypothetical protein